MSGGEVRVCDGEGVGVRVCDGKGGSVMGKDWGEGMKWGVWDVVR